MPHPNYQVPVVTAEKELISLLVIDFCKCARILVLSLCLAADVAVKMKSERSLETVFIEESLW